MHGGGDLDHRVAFDRRVQTEDGCGNERGDFQEQFSRWAAFVYAGGGEAVMAARLEGRGVVKVRVRACSQTRTIEQHWRMRDLRRGTEYAIREVDAVTDPAWVYIVVERGVAA